MLQSVTVQPSTGRDISEQIFFPFCCCCHSFSSNNCLNKKTYFEKIVWSATNLVVGKFPFPGMHFEMPWWPFLTFDILTLVALQWVWCCRRWASGPGAARLLFYLLIQLFIFIFKIFIGWYNFCSVFPSIYFPTINLAFDLLILLLSYCFKLFFLDLGFDLLI